LENPEVSTIKIRSRLTRNDLIISRFPGQSKPERPGQSDRIFHNKQENRVRTFRVNTLFSSIAELEGISGGNKKSHLLKSGLSSHLVVTITKLSNQIATDFIAFYSSQVP